jgi:NAD(P)-dependent dehydrogenase (short-subunit alcohol dehydrogenase family)
LAIEPVEEKGMSERKVVVITGASRGLGRAMAEGFMRQGLAVAGCSRSETPDVASLFKPPNYFRVVDARDAGAVLAFAEAVIEALGVPDLLINNAAVINRPSPLWELSAEEFSTIVDINIKGVFHVVRAFAPAMIRRNSGVIVNFSSGWGRSTSPEVAAYCATKYAVEGLTQALAQELPGGMAAVPLNPGVIDTEMLRTCFGSSAGSYPKPEEWAKQAVPFLLSLGPSHTGEALTVPGAALA